MIRLTIDIEEKPMEGHPEMTSVHIQGRRDEHGATELETFTCERLMRRLAASNVQEMKKKRVVGGEQVVHTKRWR